MLNSRGGKPHRSLSQCLSPHPTIQEEHLPRLTLYTTGIVIHETTDHISSLRVLAMQCPRFRRSMKGTANYRTADFEFAGFFGAEDGFTTSMLTNDDVWPSLRGTYSIFSWVSSGDMAHFNLRWDSSKLYLRKRCVRGNKFRAELNGTEERIKEGCVVRK